MTEDNLTFEELLADVTRAGEVQRLIVPPADGLEVGHLRIHSLFEPASGCGGDWWTGAPLPGGDSLLFLGDVTGHGAASAVVTGMLKGAFEVARLGMGRGLKPEQMLTMLNRVIGLSLMGKYLVTSVAIRHRPSKGEILFGNAGHPPFWRVRQGQVTQLRGSGEPALGLSLNQRYEGLNAQVDPGDILVIISDGITECENEKGEQLGERAVQEVIERYWKNGGAAVRNAIAALVSEHVHVRTDDHTLVVVEVVNPA